MRSSSSLCFFFQAEDGIRDGHVTGVQTCALPIFGIATVTREPAAHGVGNLKDFIAFGASPRGPISLVQASRALALVRGRDYVLADDRSEERRVGKECRAALWTDR